MLKAFLIVWTLVAGLAAGSLMYIVGWRPQATIVAGQISSGRDSAKPLGQTESPGAQDAAASADSGPASTGSIASGRSATRTVRRVDAASPSSGGSEASGTQAKEQTIRSDRRIDVASAPRAGDTTVRPPERPAVSPQAAIRPDIVVLPVEDDHEADPTTPRMRAAPSGSKPGDHQASPTAAAPPKPAIADADSRPRSRSRDKAAPGEPEVARVSAEAAQTNANRAVDDAKAKDRRAAKAAARATRAAARREQERTRVAAADVESPADIRRRLLEARNRQERVERRQARMERRTRIARDGSLENLLDEFSRSGDDYLHERTIRVGTRYLVERTTRQGTQYFYEQR